MAYEIQHYICQMLNDVHNRRMFEKKVLTYLGEEKGVGSVNDFSTLRWRLLFYIGNQI